MVRWASADGGGAAEGAEYETERVSEFRHAASGGVSQGDAADGDRGQVFAADRYAGGYSGAYHGKDAEERGQGRAIAQNLREMSRLGVPVIVIVIGEGGSGGALALGVGNRVYMMENAVYSVISPESCAAIIYRDSGKAPQAAAALKLTAPDLLDLGLIDAIIPEPGEGAHSDPDSAAETLGIALREALGELSGLSPQQLIEERYLKFRNMGGFFTELAALQG